MILNGKESLGQQSKDWNGYFYNILDETHQFTLSAAGKLQLQQKQESQHITIMHSRAHCQFLSWTADVVVWLGHSEIWVLLYT